QMTEIENIHELSRIFADNGWTMLTLINISILCLLHWPCAATILSIYRESRSIKWTILAFLLPAGIGGGICFLTAQGARLIGLV
ncbi:MAG: ferrous iron transporter B, partial [Selenomonadales bacterium]|nr:ferrous iron transporter B [Selenomonadales bacterium]